MSNKYINFIRISAAIAFLAGMFAIAAFFGENDIIFPEILAILIGAWITNRQPWNVSKYKMVLVMTVAAVWGLTINCYVHLGLYPKVLMGLLAAIFILFLSKTTMVPLVSASVLPIMIGIESWTYPISVFVMVSFIEIIQYIMEKYGWRQYKKYEKNKFEFNLWIKRYICLIAVLYFPLVANEVYFVIPPLLVAFIELSNPNHPMEKLGLKLLGLIFAVGFIATFVRLTMVEILNLPSVYAVTISTIFIVFIMSRVKIWFPPIGAIAILPYILPKEGLYLYPLEVSIGFMVLLLLAKLVQKNWLWIFQKQKMNNDTEIS